MRRVACPLRARAGPLASSVSGGMLSLRSWVRGVGPTVDDQIPALLITRTIP